MLKTALRNTLPPGLWSALRAVWTSPHYVRNSILLRRQRQAQSAFQTRVVKHSYGGFDLEVCLSDPIAEKWYDLNWEELPEIALLRRHKLKPGAKVFDLGAHQCVVALMMARIVGPAGFVLALEANPYNAGVGEKNKELNGATQLQVLQGAVTASVGSILINELLNGSVDDGTSGLGQIEVQAFSIDALTESYGVPDILFIDVEGFECEALKGATETLKSRPDCFVEVHTQGGLESWGGSVDMVLSFFSEGYDLFMSSDAQAHFVPFDRQSPITNERFFLVAISGS